MSRPPLKDRNENSGLVPLGPIPGQAPVASFNSDGIENLIQTKGFKCIHYRHAHTTDMHGEEGPLDPQSENSQRGFIYYDPMVLYNVPQKISLEEKLVAAGIFKEGSVILNLSGLYADTDEEVNVSIRDLIIFPSLSDKAIERTEYDPDGQKMKRRIKSVDYLSDGKCRYMQGRDFIIKEGEIRWTNEGLRPTRGTDPVVLSVVYYYTPIYVIISKPHSLRVIPSNDQGHGGLPRDAVYAPQLVVAKDLIIEQDKPGQQKIALDFSELPNYDENGNWKKW